jgi:WhiB family redox-sensing transcriptional regulator
MTTHLPIISPALPGAACADTTYPDDFFPGKWDSGAEAKAICRRCEERPACLKWALDNNEQHGIWAGYSEAELRKMRRNRDRKSRAKESA